MEKKGYSLIHVIIIIVATSIISAVTVGVIFVKGNNSNNIDYKRLSTDENLSEFLEIYNQILEGYYEDVDQKEVIQSAINGMMEYLDESYTTYLDGEEASSLIDQLNGTYEGVGVTIKDYTIINTVVDSPAEKAGVLSGDIIVDVNGVPVEGKSSNEIVDMIKQNKDNIVLGVQRNGEYLTFNLSLKTLNKPSVSYNMIENTKIGYIQISVFSEGTTKEVETAVKKLTDLGMQKIILDVRNNTGGYLEEAYDTASLFIEKGKLIYSLTNKEKTDKYYDKSHQKDNRPMVVVVNEGTASAAEILAAALKDSYNATLVGKKTFGKGKVQHTYTLESGDIVKYTSSKWLRPTGHCIDGIGLQPDYQVINETVYDNSVEPPAIIDIIDNQLNKAIELLSV